MQFSFFVVQMHNDANSTVTLNPEEGILNFFSLFIVFSSVFVMFIALFTLLCMISTTARCGRALLLVRGCTGIAGRCDCEGAIFFMVFLRVPVELFLLWNSLENYLSTTVS